MKDHATVRQILDEYHEHLGPIVESPGNRSEQFAFLVQAHLQKMLPGERVKLNTFGDANAELDQGQWYLKIEDTGKYVTITLHKDGGPSDLVSHQVNVQDLGKPVADNRAKQAAYDMKAAVEDRIGTQVSTGRVFRPSYPFRVF